MDQAQDVLEWQSIIEALRGVSAAEAHETLSHGTMVGAYTDGACIHNPGGPAGWSVILFPTSTGTLEPGIERIECFGHIPKSKATTNNRAEIAAVLAALSLAPRDLPLKIYSDSEYTIKVATGVYQMKANPDLWSYFRILRNSRKSDLAFEWVRGHAGHDLNERADALAGLGAWNNDREAYDRWQASSKPEAHNAPNASDLEALRGQVQRLQAFIDGTSSANGRVSDGEREFVRDMAKRLRKSNFSPSDKQRNWLKGLVAKYRV